MYSSIVFRRSAPLPIRGLLLPAGPKVVDDAPSAPGRCSEHRGETSYVDGTGMPRSPLYNRCPRSRKAFHLRCAFGGLPLAAGLCCGFIGHIQNHAEMMSLFQGATVKHRRNDLTRRAGQEPADEADDIAGGY